MLPTFGCNLQPKVFEVMNVANIALIEKIVHDALVYHEPRIKVEELSTEVNQQEGRLLITIQYTIISTNTRYNYVFPFYMNEATNIEHS
jgi:phage baseplate assembly protein W